MENSLDKVLQLNGVSYVLNSDAANNTRLGLIAQDVLRIVPEAVTQHADGYYAIDYISIIPLLVEAIKSQQAEIDELKTGSSNKTNGGSSENSLSMKNEKGVKLFQNIPNPFNQKTTIGYELPENVTDAFIMICDLTGKQIRKVSLTQKGQSQIEIQAGELSAGIYFYSLIADGKEVDTKKMILTE